MKPRVSSCDPVEILVRIIRYRGSIPLSGVTLTPTKEGEKGDFTIKVEYPQTRTRVDGPFDTGEGLSIYYGENSVFLFTPGDPEELNSHDNWRKITF